MKGYGNEEVLSAYAGRRAILPPRTAWQHGWIPSFTRILTPEQIVGEDGLSRFRKDWTYYVAREDQAEALRDFGYSSVHAIGLPIVYTARVEETGRRAGSLLAVPHHSGPKSIASPHAHQVFARYLKDRMPDFSSVTVLIHGWDWQMGVGTVYEALGLNAIRGAQRSDTNSLERICRLFSTHETVLSNEPGSAIAYAAFLGARVAVGGVAPPSSAPSSGGSSALEYKPGRNSIDLIVAAHQSEHWQSEPTLQFLTREPIDAETAIDWGRFEVGEDCRRAPEEIAELFGMPAALEEEQIIQPSPRVKFSAATRARAARYRSSLVQSLPSSVRHVARSAATAASLEKGPRAFTNACRILALELSSKPHVSLSASGAASRLSVSRDPSDLQAAHRIFVEDPLVSIRNLVASAESICVVGAHCGYSVARIRMLNRTAQLTAVEPRDDFADRLQASLDSAAQVRVVRKALWTESGVVDVAEADGRGTSTTVLRSAWDAASPVFRVQAMSWEHFSQEFIPPSTRSLVFLSVEGAEGELFRHAGSSIIAACETCVVSVKQNAEVMKSLLEGLIDAYEKVVFDMVTIGDFLVLRRVGDGSLRNRRDRFSLEYPS